MPIADIELAKRLKMKRPLTEAASPFILFGAFSHIAPQPSYFLVGLPGAKIARFSRQLIGLFRPTAALF